MKLDKIYTRTGDEGKTSLGDGLRIPKFHIRVTAYGSVDEANSVLGIAALHVDDAYVLKDLGHIQNDLFDVGADLCRPERQNAAAPSLRVTGEQVKWLEDRIDHYNANLSPLDSFVLPGGSPASAHLHHARTVTRRAEERYRATGRRREGHSCCARIGQPASRFAVWAGAIFARQGRDGRAVEARPASVRIEDDGSAFDNFELWLACFLSRRNRDGRF